LAIIGRIITVVIVIVVIVGLIDRTPEVDIDSCNLRRIN
jgi:hypothetical protein